MRTIMNIFPTSNCHAEVVVVGGDTRPELVEDAKSTCREGGFGIVEAKGLGHFSVIGAAYPEEQGLTDGELEKLADLGNVIDPRQEAA